MVYKHLESRILSQPIYEHVGVDDKRTFDDLLDMLEALLQHNSNELNQAKAALKKELPNHEKKLQADSIKMILEQQMSGMNTQLTEMGEKFQQLSKNFKTPKV